MILIGPDEEASRVESEIQEKVELYEQREASGNGRGAGVCVCKQACGKAAAVHFCGIRCSLQG